MIKTKKQLEEQIEVQLMISIEKGNQAIMKDTDKDFIKQKALEIMELPDLEPMRSGKAKKINIKALKSRLIKLLTKWAKEDAVKK